ncbi:MAG TPA: DMT family transporter [Patescibacteria group bacterium]|nr:DMT family transporter [Patescibacteria group bacterium]
MFPFIAALAQVGGILIDKVILTRRQVSLHVFVPILFLFLFLSTALLFPSFGEINERILETRYLLIFGAMIVIAVLWNIFYYQGVQAEKVQEFELIVMFQPLLTILLAAIFLENEQNPVLVIVSLIAAASLIIAHINKTHLEISRGSSKLILAVILMSVELILIKILLEVFSPVALYLIRTGIIFIFFVLLYQPQIKKVAPQNILLILSSGLLGTAQMVTKFYGFTLYGVVYTSLILILSPILVYVFSIIFLHERIRLRTMISAAVILLCIVYATMIGK